MKRVTIISACMVLFPLAVNLSHAQSVASNSESEHLDLTEEEMVDVRSSLNRVTAEVFADAIAKDYESKGLNISPFLATIILDENESVSTRTHAIFLLGQLEDPASTDAFMQIIEPRLKQDIVKDDLSLIRCSMIALGWQGDQRGLGLLFQMASKEFWDQIAPDGVTCGDCDNIPAGNVSTYLREQALSALAGSGTDEALRAFATGEGLPADLSRSFPHYLDLAVYRKCDIIAIPDKLSKLDQDEQSQYWDTWSWIQKEFGSREDIYQRFRNESGHAPQPALSEGAAKNEVADWIAGNDLTVTGKAKVDSILENRQVNFDDQMMVNLVGKYPETAVAKYLMEVADDSNRHAVTRQRAMAWLAYTRDDRAEDFLRSYVEQLTKLDEKDLDFVEFNLLHAAIMSQGSIGSNSSIDYLLQISSKDFWEGKTLRCGWLKMDAEGVETHMRKAALWGIVRSETSRAIALFPGGSNPMPDLLSEEEAASLARTARLRAQKVYVDPEAQREASQLSESSNIQGK